MRVSSAGRLHDRQRERERRALPGRDSAHTRPPFAAANPRAIARPSPAPDRSRPRWNGSKTRSSSDSATPGPLVDDTEDRLAPRRRDPHVDASTGRRELERVLDEVREHALDLDRVDVDQRLLTAHLDPVGDAELGHDVARELVERPHLRLRLGAAGLEPGQVEQVADEPREALGIDRDRVEQLAAVARR